MPEITIEQLTLLLDANISRMEKKLDKALGKTDKVVGGMQKRLDALTGNLEGQFQNAVSGAASQVPVLGDAIGALGPEAIGATAVLGGLAVALTQAKAAMDWADDLQATADHLNVTAEFLQEMGYAAGEADVEVGQMQESLANLNASLGAMQSGAGAAKLKKAFDALKISRDDLKGMRDASELLPLLADRISQLGTHAEKVAIARKLGIEALLPMLQQGAKGLDDMRQSARDLGLVIDNETTRSLADMNREVEVAGQRIDVQLKKAFLGLAPAIEGATTALADFLTWLNKPAPGGQTVGGLLFSLGPKALFDPAGAAKDALGAAGGALKDYDARHGTHIAQTLWDGWAGAGATAAQSSAAWQANRHKTGNRIQDIGGGSAAAAGAAIGDASASGRGRGAGRSGKTLAEQYADLVASLQTEEEKAEAAYAKGKAVLDAMRKQISPAEYQKELKRLKAERDRVLEGGFTPKELKAEPYKQAEVTLDDFETKARELGRVVHPVADELHNAAQDLAYQLGEAVAYGDDLGDVLVNSFRRAEAELLSQAFQQLFAMLFPATNQSTGKVGGVIGQVGKLFHLPGFAGGTNSTPSGPYLVGEKGPEIMWGAGRKVLPLDRLRGLPQGPGASVHVTQIDLRGAYVETELWDRVEAISRRNAAAAAGMGERRAVTTALGLMPGRLGKLKQHKG